MDSNTNEKKDVIATKELTKSEKIKKEIIEYAKALLLAAVIAALFMMFIARSFTVNGMSMEPNFHNGERVMVDKISYRFSEIKRGDVVVLKPFSDSREKFIKRVIGLSGDKIEVRERIVYVNDIAIQEPYIYMPTLWDFGPVEVPEGKVFCMGDNRNNSMDSRSEEVGFIDKKAIEGRALFTYWPLKELGICEHYRNYPIELQTDTNN